MIVFVTLMSSLSDQILLVVIKGKLQARERSPSTHWLFGSQSTMSSLAWMETEETSCKKMFRAHLILILRRLAFTGLFLSMLGRFSKSHIIYTHLKVWVLGIVGHSEEQVCAVFLQLVGFSQVGG